ncbi:MAG: formate dehydrogenase subunit gamma [Rhodospirillales bacterium]|nr:formate dehydrogenase subunit gamma [Rhodospirillales bacterium]
MQREWTGLYHGSTVIRAAVLFLILVLGLPTVHMGAAWAQDPAADPVLQQGDLSDADVWRAVREGARGSVTIPDPNAAILIQSSGETWRAIHNGPLPEWGAWGMLGMIIVLGVYFAIRGRIRVEAGPSGRVVERFGSMERLAHWLVAVSFIILGVTGLNTLYGRYVIKPVIGADAFSALAQFSKYLHNYVAFAFMVGLVLILVLWIRDNIPNRYDWIWLKKGGGMFSRHLHPPARRFNAGQKIIFWLVILGGVSISLSGIELLFPFEFALFSKTFAFLNIFGLGLPTELSAIEEIQLAQVWHGIISLFLISVIIAHVYIGTIGMEGAFDAMGSGQVDLNWAREHHSVWVSELEREVQQPSAAAPLRSAGDD